VQSSIRPPDPGEPNPGLKSEDATEGERIRETAQSYAEHFPSLDSAAIEVYVSLLHTLRVHSVAIERYLASLDQGKPLSAARHTVLRTLYFADGKRLSQNELSGELGVSRTNITHIIDALERDGLLVRVTNPSDRRSNYIELTPQGVTFCSSFVPTVAQFMASMFEDLSEPELAELNRLLARVREGMYRRYIFDDAPAETANEPLLPD
jgi:MarR family 2-MHQ and catechol resistance regulon transcriptional repressor